MRIEPAYHKGGCAAATQPISKSRMRTRVQRVAARGPHYSTPVSTSRAA